MKETWVKPIAEKVEFDYKDQVTAANSSCSVQYTNDQPGVCTYEANWAL